VLEQQVAENAGEAAGTHEAPQGFDQPLDGFDTLFPVAPPPRGEQGVLFTDPVSVVEENLGYRGAVACKAAGITYRQLDYWARTDLVVPTVRGAPRRRPPAPGLPGRARRLHDEHVANGKAEGERIVTEARSTGEQIVREAEDQRNRTLAQLEKERAALEQKIDELRRFESDYRTRLKSYLQNLLANVEDGGESSISSL